MSHDYIPLLCAAALCAVFSLVAVILLIVVPIARKKRVALCTMPVRARIASVRTIRLSPSSPGNAPNYSPIYEFTCNGETYTRESAFMSSRMPVVGSETVLMVNPENVDQFYDPVQQKRAKVIVLIVGIAMLLMAVIAAVITAAIGILVLQ